jgi:plasmid stabilization system protein ParE
MGYKIVWGDPAISDLHRICHYIGQDNREASIRTGMKIHERAASLAAFPELGPRYKRRFRVLTEGNFRIFYLIDTDQLVVRIVRIRHSSQLPLTVSSLILASEN